MAGWNSASVSLLLVCFCFCAWAATSQNVPPPGVDNRPDAYTGACMPESNQLLALNEIRNEIGQIHSEVAKIEVMDHCELLDNPSGTGGDRYECLLDFKSMAYAFKSSCGRNQGTFMEGNQRVHCMGGRNEEASAASEYSWQFLNYPLCTGEDCTAADVDRLLARSILQTEAALQAKLQHAICKADPNGEFRGTDFHNFMLDQEESMHDILDQVKEEALKDVLEEETAEVAESAAAFLVGGSVIVMSGLVALVL